VFGTVFHVLHAILQLPRPGIETIKLLILLGVQKVFKTRNYVFFSLVFETKVKAFLQSFLKVLPSFQYFAKYLGFNFKFNFLFATSGYSIG